MEATAIAARRHRDRQGRRDPGGDPRARRRPRLGRGPRGPDDRPARGRAGDEQERPLRPFRLQAGAAAGDGRGRRASLSARTVIEPAARARPRAPRGCGRWPTPTSRTSTRRLLGRLLLGARPRPSTTTGPARCATRSPPRSMPGSASSSARPSSPASTDPERVAFELYAVVMGANSRYRLSGDRRVFDYARGGDRSACSARIGPDEQRGRPRLISSLASPTFWSAPDARAARRAAGRATFAWSRR